MGMMDSVDVEDLARVGTVGFDQQLLSTLLQQVPCGVLVVEAPSGKVILSNHRLEEIWRGSAATDLSRWTGFHADGTPYSLAEWPISGALATGQSLPEEEIEILREDGTRAVIRCSAEPLRAQNGDLTGAVMTALDVTDLRRRTTSRRLLADAGALLASSLDYVSTLRSLARLAIPTLADWCTVDLLDSAGEIERVAIEHTDARLATAATQLARRNPPALKTEVVIEEVIRTGESRLIPEVTSDILAAFTRSSRQRKLLSDLGMSSAMIVPLVSRGRPLGALTFVTAESGRHYNADDLEVAEELATRAALVVENSRLFDQSRAATEAKSDFLAVMSHELRTPLTAIIGYSELLQLGVPDTVTARQREQAERIEVSARHLLQLIEEILTLVTLESGERRVRREEVDVNKLLKRAVSIVEPMARAKGLPLTVEFAEGDPMLRSDIDKLLQVLSNLLSNAVKFTEKGEIRLKATANERAVLIEVSDTGIGLGSEHLQRIFEPFWQVERPITRRTGGTGLGLAISRRLVDLLGAELEVDSQQGTGSTFRLRIPL
jgi:signal transduction histidine kinase